MKDNIKDIAQKIRANREARQDTLIAFNESHIVLNALEEIARLTAENAALNARLSKAVELPCKVGDTIYTVYEKEIREWKVKSINLGGESWSIRCGQNRTDNIIYLYDKVYGVWWFTDHVKAEARLAELRGKK